VVVQVCAIVKLTGDMLQTCMRFLNMFQTSYEVRNRCSASSMAWGLPVSDLRSYRSRFQHLRCLPQTRRSMTYIRTLRRFTCRRWACPWPGPMWMCTPHKRTEYGGRVESTFHSHIVGYPKSLWLH